MVHYEVLSITQAARSSSPAPWPQPRVVLSGSRQGACLPAQAAEDGPLGALHGSALLRAGLVVEAQQMQQAMHQQDAALVVQAMPAAAAALTRDP